VAQLPIYGLDGDVRDHALVDDDDFEWLSSCRWHLVAGYPRNGNNVYMHRLILGLPKGDRRMGEHKNRNKLDNQRSNLRIAQRGHRDNKQNLGIRADNTSGYRGVVWQKRQKRWRATAMLDGKRYHLGYRDTPEECDEIVKAWRAEHMPFSEDAERSHS
jgi:AP2 domain